MNHLLSVSLVALTLAVNIAPRVVAQSAGLQPGISVQMAVTSNATPMPEADNEDAWVVAVTDSGSVYLGIDPITPTALEEKVRGTQFKLGQQLYIKADARAPYSKVLQVLEATRTGGIARQVLLTNQPESPAPGTIMPPKGLEVESASPSTSFAEANTLQLINSGRPSPTVKLNHQPVSWENLPEALRLFQSREKVVLLKAAGDEPFADIAHVIDLCRAAGSKVTVETPIL